MNNHGLSRRALLGSLAAGAALAATQKISPALAALDSEAVAETHPLDVHRSDALLAAAWLRRAAPQGRYWAPPRLTANIAATEGWTFGAV